MENISHVLWIFRIRFLPATSETLCLYGQFFTYIFSVGYRISYSWYGASEFIIKRYFSTKTACF